MTVTDHQCCIYGIPTVHRPEESYNKYQVVEEEGWWGPIGHQRTGNQHHVNTSDELKLQGH